MGGGLCKSCYLKHRYHTDGGKTKQQMQDYAAAHPRMRAAIWRKHAYGLSEVEWFALYEKHNGRCAICGKPEPINKLNIDHCHATDRVRGMLCGHCNKGLGHFFDKPHLVERATEYLRQDEKMPRKKTIDPIDQILSFAETAETSTILIVIGLLNREVKKRQPPAEVKPVTRRRRIKPAPAQTLTETAAAEMPVLNPPKPKPRRRRMRADSKPPASEATPIVPLQSEVGEGDPAGDETYTGN